MDRYDKLILVLVLLIATSIMGYFYRRQEAHDFDIEEHFEGGDYTQHIVNSEVTNIYDHFYANLYDTLFNNEIKNEFEMYNILEYTSRDKKVDQPKGESSFIDLGSGTGGHLKILSRDKIKAVGVDRSLDMLQKSRKVLLDTPLIKGDMLNQAIFKKQEFSHVLCLFFTMYYNNAKQVDQLFKNVNVWLRPKGFFAVHLVNPAKFDPVLEKSSKLIPMYNPQKHTESRVTRTKLKFNKFNFVGDWNFNKQQVTFVEHFMFHDHSKHRQNVHHFTMYPIKFYVQTAKRNGFKLIKIIDLLPVNHDNSYIYIFQKVYGD